MNEIEIWKDVLGYESKYKISNFGRIKSLNYNNTNQEKILIPKINKQGNLEITLNKNNKHNYFMVNRLVIKTFCNKELTKNDIIMYRDNNKTNCSLDNLYIISRGKRQELTYEYDRRFCPKYEYYGENLSTKQISNKTGIDSKTIRNRIRNLYWSIYEAAEIPKGIILKKIINGGLD